MENVSVGVRRDDPLLLQVRLEEVFWRPPDRVIAARGPTASPWALQVSATIRLHVLTLNPVGWLLHWTTRLDCFCVRLASIGAATLFWRLEQRRDLDVSRENVAELAAAGRARWKIENETFNVLKTKGYNLEHNFGHGKQHLATVLAILNLLAFGCHRSANWRTAPGAPPRGNW
jgi:hypothetical protein